MYIGSSGPFGILALALEVIDNVVDLILADQASSIDVTIHADGSIAVRDDGPGMNLEDENVLRYFEQHHVDATADGHMPHLHVGGGGLGLFVVASLCEKLTVESAHRGLRQRCEWAEGGAARNEVSVEKASEPAPSFSEIRFWPDREIFGEARLVPEELLKRLRELQHLLHGLRHIRLVHSMSQPEDGLATMMRERLRLHSDRVWRDERTMVDPDAGLIEVDLAIALNHVGQHPQHRLKEQMLLFCNFVEVTEESGLHHAMRVALGGSANDAMPGLVAACNLRMLAPKFSGPTRRRLDDPAAMDAITASVGELLATYPDLRSAVAEHWPKDDR